MIWTRRARTIILSGILLLVAWTPARGQASLPSGEALERDLRFQEARDAYAAILVRAPRSPEAARAEVRLVYLDAHAEGGFAPLARLERLRRDPSPSEVDVEALERESEAFPPGLVVLEARLFCAEHWLRNGQARRAIPMLERVASDAPGGEPLGRHAARRAIDLRLEQGDLAGAREVLVAMGPRADATVVSRVERAGRRRILDRTSTGVLVVFGAAVVAGLARATRDGKGKALLQATRRALPVTLVFAFLVAVLGGALARYHGGDVRPFVWFATFTVPILLGAQALGVSLGPRLRVPRALLGLASALASAFLTLSWLDARYLEGFGL